MRNRSMRNTTFNLPSMRKLWERLGQYDALVEFEECCCRTFIKDSPEPNNLNEGLCDRAKAVDIYLTNLPFEDYRSILNCSYLVFPYACFDKFLTDFRKDISELINLDFSIPKKNGETKLEFYLRVLKDGGITVDIQNQKPIFDYYRLIRNAVAHNQEDQKECSRYYNQIDLKATKQMYPNLDPPNKFDKINFNDFITATANIKNLCDILTISIEKHIDYTKVIANQSLFPDIDNFKNRPKERLKTYINNCFKNKYGIALPEEHIESIIQKLN